MSPSHVVLCIKYKPKFSGTGSVIAFTLRTRLKLNRQLGPAGKDIQNAIPNLSDFISNIDGRKTEKKSKWFLVQHHRNTKGDLFLYLASKVLTSVTTFTLFLLFLISNYFSSFFPANSISNMTSRHNWKLLKHFKWQSNKGMAEHQTRGTLKIQMFYWPCSHISSTATCPRILCYSPATKSRKYGPCQYNIPQCLAASV